MKTQICILAVALGLLAVPLMAYSADRKEAGTGTAKARQSTSAVQNPVATAEQPKPGLVTATAVASPQSGEQIKWQVVAGGGGASSSLNFKISATLGQTASGPASSTSYKANQGFWQNFAPASCCVGVTGDVNSNGSVNLADLSSLVSYLTGGGFALPCVGEADLTVSGTVNLADLSSLVSYLTGGGYVLPSCP